MTTTDPDDKDELNAEHRRLMAERLHRHAGETGRADESLLEILDRILLDHDKLHHGAE